MANRKPLVVNAGGVQQLQDGDYLTVYSSVMPALKIYSINVSANARNWSITTNQYAYGDLRFMKSNAKDGDPITAGTIIAGFDANGNFGVGTNVMEGRLHVAIASGQGGIYSDVYSSNQGYTTFWFSRKSASNTLGTKAQTSDGDYLGVYYFQGVGSGGGWSYGQKISIRQDGAAGANCLPSQVVFSTYDSGGSIVQQLVLRGDGDAYFGSNQHLNDLKATYYGDANDALIYYDSANLIINPKAVGSGILDVLGTLQTDGYNAADGTAGASATVAVSDLEGDTQTLTFKNGLYTGVAETVSKRRTFVLYNTTTNDTATELFLNGSSTRLTIPEGETWFFTVRCAARQTNGDFTTYGSMWTGILTRDSGGNATITNYTKVLDYVNDFGWDYDISADTTNQSLKITVTGGATDTVKWVACVDLTIAGG